jgi:PAS domain S-box-containing protein
MSTKRILVVDDERIVVRDISESLESKGYEVCGTAMDGSGAIEKARQLKPDLILMDIVLQGEMDGIEAACAIREELGIPVIFLTAYSQGAVLERAKSAEPLGYVLKPFDDGGLHSVVEIALHKAVTERVVREKGEWFHTTLKCIGDGVISSDPKGLVEFMNDAASRLTGWPNEDAAGVPVHDVVTFASPGTADGADEIGDTQEVILIAKGGRRIPVTKTASRIVDSKGRVMGYVIVLRDDTFQHEARQQQLQFQLGLECLVKKRTEELEAANAVMREEIAIRHVAERALQERLDLEELIAGMSSDLAMRRSEDVKPGIDKAIQSLGEFYTARRAAVYLLSPDGTLLSHAHGWKSEGTPDLSRRFLDLPCDAYFWLMSQLALLQPVLVSSVAELPSDAAAERRLFDRSGLESALIVPLANNARLLGFLQIGCASTDSVWKQNDIRTVNLAGQLISGAVSRMSAATARLALQAQLFQSQKVEAIGKLTGGLAHDFNNMLMPILGFSDLLLARPQDEAPDRDLLLQIQSAAKSAASLAAQLLAYSRKQPIERKVGSLNSVILKMEKLIPRVIGEDIRLVTELDTDLRTSRIDAGQIEQILMNLAVNARAAMPTGGTLSIKTANVAGAICGLAGQAVLLEISDTGCGMPPDVMAQAFEPFFTTKGNQGTGLGLSVVKGIVEQHDGEILLDSKAGRGAKFHIFFPAESSSSVVEEDVSPLDEADLLGRKWGMGRSVLIVEDEETVSDFLKTVLRGFGFAVTTADAGGPAMTAFAQADPAFDLVICDIVLPDANGIDLVREFLLARPELPVIFSTGQSERFVLVPAGNVQLLQKPYSISELCQKVDAALAALRKIAA